MLLSLLTIILLLLFACLCSFLYLRCFKPYKLQNIFKLKNSSSMVAKWIAGLPTGSSKDSDETEETNVDEDVVVFDSQEHGRVRFHPSRRDRAEVLRGESVPPNFSPPTDLLTGLPRLESPSTTSVEIHNISDQPFSSTHPVQRRSLSLPPPSSPRQSRPAIMDIIQEEPVSLADLPRKISSRVPTQEEIELGFTEARVIEDMIHFEWLKKARRNKEKSRSGEKKTSRF